ncbi:MAG: hypothetical protein GY874_03465 [Desulfobacteraceae bacterium]|nr:hypothetical protein [Desulfobacteraceae bacterium]
MRLDSNPMFRKILSPWYDSDTTCWLILAGMAAICIFCINGILVARQIPAYNKFEWIPWTLMGLCLSLCLFAGLRLLNRYLQRHSQHKEP